METCAEVSKELGQAVNKICKGTDTANAFKDFTEDSVEAEEFAEYFKATWYPRMGNSLTTKRLVNGMLLIIWSHELYLVCFLILLLQLVGRALYGGLSFF